MRGSRGGPGSRGGACPMPHPLNRPCGVYVRVSQTDDANETRINQTNWVFISLPACLWYLHTGLGESIKQIGYLLVCLPMVSTYRVRRINQTNWVFISLPAYGIYIQG
uniref:Uncharacterized protein n=1 Tax=Cacopsylla melanoneura TaxID=428564 RepID=A0A8D9ELB9_9HEMI